MVQKINKTFGASFLQLIKDAGVAPEDDGVFECCICYTGMVPGEKIAQLVCHNLHVIHEDCYNSLIEHFGQEASCPLCREPIERNKVIFSVMPAKPEEKVDKIED